MSAYDRAAAAVNLLGPLLFPLITAAEERISGTRPMPLLQQGHHPRGDRYELTGVVDVISSVQVARDVQNPLVQIIQEAVPPLGQAYDLIVDYKSMRRPALDDEYWQHHEWQVRTYAWLRTQTPTAERVGAGLIIYINELSPSSTDMIELQRDFGASRTDVVPIVGSADYYAIQRWQRGARPPELTFEFRLRRAIHVIDVAVPHVETALASIDGVVAEIETSAAAEFAEGDIPSNWIACGDDRDCVACDFKHFCPSPAQARADPQNWVPTPPIAPG